MEITEGRSTDVFEIDAASHTGVDNVRDIIDNVRYLPSSARFKIYVIDEVHMLSTGAFNALLKTLEEPPAHVKFILATTDVHKVPVTILSRCQRYDFRRISLAEIAERLSKILDEEKIVHDPSALSLIAREAEGSMRDAQSLLEQVLAYAGDRRLDGALVRDALGVVDGALIARAFDALLGRNPGALIELAAEVHLRGLDLKRFADALVEEARDLLVAKLLPDPSSALDRPKDEIAALVERAKSLESMQIERLFHGLAAIVEEVKEAAHPRFVLEVNLAALAEKPAHVPVEILLEKISKLETLLAGTAPSPNSLVRRTQNDWRAGGRTPAQYAKTAAEAEPDARLSTPVVSEPIVPAPAVSTPVARTEEVPAPVSAPPPASDKPAQTFAAFHQLLTKKRPSLAATLTQVRPLSFRPGEVELGCETAFDEAKLKDQETKDYLEALLSELFNTKTLLKVSRTYRNAGGPPPAEKSLAEVADEKRETRRNEKGTDARSRSAVQTVADELGATISKVRVIDPE